MHLAKISPGRNDRGLHGGENGQGVIYEVEFQLDHIPQKE
jgi:hypothetical protein